jgi:hypothetical protein
MDDLSGLDGEHLCRMCQNCGYGWPEACLDNQVEAGTKRLSPVPPRAGGRASQAPRRNQPVNQDAPAPSAASDGAAVADPGGRAKVVPGAGLDWSVVLRDAAGYPFAVGTAGGQVVIQVAATAPRGTVRLSDEHVAELALTLAQATARAGLARPLVTGAGGAR